MEYVARCSEDSVNLVEGLKDGRKRFVLFQVCAQVFMMWLKKS